MMTYLLTGISAFAGSLVAVAGFTGYQNYRKTQAQLKFYKELMQTIEDEITFAEIAENLSKDMNYDD